MESREAVKLAPGSVEARCVMAQIFRDQARQQAGPAAEQSMRLAAAQLEEIVKLEPNDGQALLQLFNTYAQINDSAKAAATLTWCLKQGRLASQPATSRAASPTYAPARHVVGIDPHRTLHLRPPEPEGCSDAPTSSHA